MSNIIIFGTGSGMEKLKNYIKSSIKVIGFSDNDKTKVGKFIDDIKIIMPDKIKELQFDYLVIASTYYNEITKQLLELGIQKEKIVPFYNNEFWHKNQNLLKDMFEIDNSLEAKLFWSRSESDSNIKDLSHWRGEGRFLEDIWLNVGQKHFDMYKKLCEISNTKIKENINILEWGAGGGANAYKFCKELNANYYDVDISLPNILEAEKQIRSLSKSSFKGIYLEKPDDFSELKNLPVKFDFILSTAVFQHFPSKEYGINVIEVISNLLSEDGLFIIQTRFDDNSKEFSEKHVDYQNNAITFTSYGIQQFRNILENKNMKVLDMLFEDNANYCYYIGKKVK